MLKEAGRFGSVRASVFLALGLGLSACDKGGPPAQQCLHPCDLAETVSVHVTGTEPAVTVSTDDPCEGGGSCSMAGECASVAVYLKEEYGAPGPDLVCHVTARSQSGMTVEQDVTARYTDDPCCSGYEFQTLDISIAFPPADAGSGDGPG